MKSIITTIAFFISMCAANAQKSIIDSVLAKKITISNFCLCQTTIRDLRKIDSNLQKISVEKMDLPESTCGNLIIDSRYENGVGYYSPKIPGIIFQKDQDTNYISNIRLTKDFKGNLPNGAFVDMQTLTLKDVFKIYPELIDKVLSRDCSDYWDITNDTISFFVKIDPNKPRYPFDSSYYSQKNIEAIELTMSCYIIDNPYIKLLLNEPVFFLDSVNVFKQEILKYQPTDIASIAVYRDTSAKLQGKDRIVVYYEPEFWISVQQKKRIKKGRMAQYLMYNLL